MKELHRSPGPLTTTVRDIELSAEKVDGLWQVRYGSKTCVHEHIDRAVAQAVRTTHAEAVDIVRRLDPPASP